MIDEILVNSPFEFQSSSLPQPKVADMDPIANVTATNVVDIFTANLSMFTPLAKNKIFIKLSW